MLTTRYRVHIAAVGVVAAIVSVVPLRAHAYVPPAATCGSVTSAALDSASYTAAVGATFAVVVSWQPSDNIYCTGRVVKGDHTLLSGSTDPACVGNCNSLSTNPSTTTLQCLHEGTFTIAGGASGDSNQVFSANSTVTCTVPPPRAIRLKGGTRIKGAIRLGGTAPLPLYAPTVSTLPKTYGGASYQFVLNGSIQDRGTRAATVCGFAWGTNSSLSGGDTATTTDSACPSNTGQFATTLNIYSSNTYYFRAYSTNAVGTGFGSILSFFVTAAP